MSRPVPWEGSLCTWSSKYLQSQVWRTEPLFDIDDLMQEAFFVWQRCAKKYPVTENSAHFMAIYKISLINQVHQIAARENSHREKVRRLGEFSMLRLVDEWVEEDRRSFDLLDGAPNLILALIQCFRNRKPRFHRVGGKRETTQDYLTRLSGLLYDTEIDMIQVLVNWREGVSQCELPILPPKSDTCEPQDTMDIGHAFDAH